MWKLLSSALLAFSALLPLSAGVGASPMPRHALPHSYWVECTLHLDFTTASQVVARQCHAYAIRKAHPRRIGWTITRTRLSPHVIRSVRYPVWYQPFDIAPAAVPCAGRWKDQIISASREYGVPTRVIAAIICVESSGDQYSNSCTDGSDNACSKGLMQLIDGTCAYVVYGSYAQSYVDACDRELYDPQFNINAGTKYLLAQYRTFGYSWANAAGAYNAGSWVSAAYVSRFMMFYA